MSDQDPQLPLPSFEFLVFSLKTQAEIQLGLLRYGSQADEPNEPSLPAARHAIDLLSMIEEKTRGNLGLEERLLIENSLTELRFRFVQVSNHLAKDGSPRDAEEAKDGEAPKESATP